MRRGLLPLMSLVLLAGAAGHAQQPASGSTQKPAATFRADVNLVEVHAVVTDERGNFVSSLTKDDFEIYEDGRRQSATVFDLVDVPLAPPARVADAVESDVRATSPTFEGRLYVFVLDDLHTTTLRSPLVRAAARRFIDEHLGPQDLAAIVYTSGRRDVAQELTSSKRLLRASIDRFQGQKLPSATAERLAIHLTEYDMERAAAQNSGDDSGGSNAQPGSDRIDDPYDAERGFNARRSLELVKEVAEWMASVNGRRKALVLFSEGIDYDIYDVFNNKSASSILLDARDAVAAAQRANVAIYAVDPRGLTQLGDEQITIASLSPVGTVDHGTSRAFQNELLLAQESLIGLAEQTGGVAVVRTNNIAGGLSRIAADNSRYYILGYVADPSRSPGKFRRIEVKVKRPGLKVRSRRGYVPADLNAAKKRETEVKTGTSPALAAALSNPLPVGELPVRVFATPLRGAGKNATVLLSIELDAATLPFDKQNDRLTNKLEFSIVAADHDGKVRDGDRQEMNLKLKPETHQRLLGSGVRVLSKLDLPPARYQLRIGVHESVGGKIATVPYDLEVPDYTKAKFALGGFALSSSAAGMRMTPAPDPAVKELFPIPPVATRQFTRGETLTVFTELYDTTTPAHTVDFITSVRAQDTEKTFFNGRDARSIDAASTAPIRYRGEVPLKDLPAGRYVLKFEAISRLDNQSIVREVPFEVRETARALTM